MRLSRENATQKDRSKDADGVGDSQHRAKLSQSKMFNKLATSLKDNQPLNRTGSPDDGNIHLGSSIVQAPCRSPGGRCCVSAQNLLASQNFEHENPALEC